MLSALKHERSEDVGCRDDRGVFAARDGETGKQKE